MPVKLGFEAFLIFITPLGPFGFSRLVPLWPGSTILGGVGGGALFFCR